MHLKRRNTLYVSLHPTDLQTDIDFKRNWGNYNLVYNEHIVYNVYVNIILEYP